MRTILLLLGLLLPVIGSAAYAVSIIRGKTRPQRMTRFLLMIITAIMWISLVAANDRAGVWLALVAFVQAMVIWVLSLRRGIGGGDRLDIACLLLCALGVVCWLVFGHAWIGLLASILADIAASAPALRKTIRMPHTELLLFYALDTLAGVCILFAGPLQLQAIVFPAYITAINLLFALAIWLPRLRAAHSRSTELV
ncbi:MAG TPA: hypothetical protein VLI54_05590 [Bacillota bacterium]|nr:hypothetical protein [Bacillota bacterium]